MKSKKFPIIVIVSIAAAVLVIYGISYAYKVRKAKTHSTSGMLGAAIETSFGTVRLVYANGATMIDGELSRSTPCVDWNIEAVKTDTGAKVEIKDMNMAEICVQSLGTPQAITQRIPGTTKESVYSVKLESATVFEGALSPIQMPAAPTEGVAQ